MTSWWVQMLTLVAGTLAVTSVLFTSRSSTPLRNPGWLLISWIFLVLALLAGSLKLWGWSTPMRAETGDLLDVRNCAHRLAETRILALVAYSSFIAGLASLLVFGWRNLPRQPKTARHQTGAGVS